MICASASVCCGTAGSLLVRPSVCILFIHYAAAGSAIVDALCGRPSTFVGFGRLCNSTPPVSDDSAQGPLASCFYLHSCILLCSGRQWEGGHPTGHSCRQPCCAAVSSLALCTSKLQIQLQSSFLPASGEPKALLQLQMLQLPCTACAEAAAGSCSLQGAAKTMTDNSAEIVRQ